MLGDPWLGGQVALQSWDVVQFGRFIGRVLRRGDVWIGRNAGLRRIAIAGSVAALCIGLMACSGGGQDGAAAVSSVISSHASATPDVTSSPPRIKTVTAVDVIDAIEAAGLPATGRADRTKVAGCADLRCSQMIAVDAVSVYLFDGEAAAEKYATTMSRSSLIYRNGSIVLRFKRDGPNPIDMTLIPQYQAALDRVLS